MIEFNHPKNEEGVYKDLLKKYKKYGTLYIGVDFDNTLWPYDLEENQEPPQGFKNVLELLRNETMSLVTPYVDRKLRVENKVV